MLTNIRFYIILITLALIGWIATWTEQALMAQTYALLAVTYLYLSLMASPVARIFTFLPFRGLYLHARRALGVSAFLFAAAHVYLTFYVGMGGWAGIPFILTLPGNYILAFSLGALAFFIFTLMALTASEFMVNKLTFPRWKMLHRLVYLAAVAIVIHALLLGSHFSNLNSLIPHIFFVALAILLVLEAIRFDRYLKSRFLSWPSFGLTVVVALAAVVGLATFFLR